MDVDYAGDSEATRSDAETDDDVEDVGLGGAALGQSHPPQQQLNSRATSPSWAPSDSAAGAAAGADEGYARLTARQRARLEKEAGLAEDVAWHQMDLLPNLTYTWKGKGIKAAGQMTEEEWLKRQEALERRRMRSLRDKREAEEAVKAKIRRAVTARFRGKLGADGDSGLDGQGGGDGQDGGPIKPGWVKIRSTSSGVSVAWHPAAHPLSLPMPVVATPPWAADPIELQLQLAGPGQAWQGAAAVAAQNSSSNSGFKVGLILTMQPTATDVGAPQAVVAVPQPEQQQQQQQHGLLCCMDSSGSAVGYLSQKQVLEELEAAGVWPGVPQPPGQQQSPPGSSTASLQHAADMAGQLDWQQWRAVVKSIRRARDGVHLAEVVVRVVPRSHAPCAANPLLPSPWLSAVASAQVHLKLESEQHTNSFKARGALNKILSLSPQQISQGLVTCSTGNHALAFVWACSVVPAAQTAPSTIYLPTTASPAKLARLQEAGAHVVQHGDDCVLAEQQARQVAEQQGGVYVSPYNDWEVMAGQGTVAVELLQQAPEALDAVIVPVGGGGLIAGIAAVLKAWKPSVQVIGVQPSASDVMRQSVAAGHIVDAPFSNTLSDATAGGIEQAALTLQPCIDYVDTWVTVSEQDIADAMVSLLQHHGKLVEGAAGCAVAACRQLSADLQGKQVAVVCCGGNVALPTLQHVLDIGRAW